MNRNLQTALLGAGGGFLGFLLSEILGSTGDAHNLIEAMLGTMLWTALYVVPLTLVLAAAENLLGMRGRWSRGLVKLLLPSVILGTVSGGVAQFLYSLGLAFGTPHRLIRALAWAVMGAGVGLVLGLVDRSWTKAWRGFLGGAVGGFIGGLVFDSFTTGDSSVAARAIGTTVLGAAIGFMLMLSQELFKTSWLLGTSGRYESKQYILTKSLVTIGRSDANDIGLYADPDVPLKAGSFERQGQTWQWQGEGLVVNGQPVTAATLRHGDQLQIGQTRFLFQSKAQSGVPVPIAPHQYMLEGSGQIIPFPGQFEKVMLGSGGNVQLTGPGIQKQHAEIMLMGGRLELLAYGPVSVNGQLVQSGMRVPVQVGDALQLGGQTFQLIRASLVPAKA